jgi:hypothetical protein
VWHVSREEWIVVVMGGQLAVGVRVADGPSWTGCPGLGPKGNIYLFIYFSNEVKLALIQKGSSQAQKI